MQQTTSGNTISRRGAIQTAASFMILPAGLARGYAANNKLNIGIIGLAGMGGVDARTFNGLGENVAAICDVDSNVLDKRAVEHPGANRYTDFRKMIETEGSNIDAVVIGTPDHSHAAIALFAMQHGKHVYCEKPLTRTVWEARLLRDAAAKYKVATQMGNQGYSHEGTRTAAEILWSGDIGAVKEVHAWTGGIYIGGDNVQSEPPEEPVPAALDWDLWLGPLPWRPYNARYCPGSFRWMMESGGGQIRDRGAHVMSCAMWWMGADGTGPVTVEATGTAPKKGLWDVHGPFRTEGLYANGVRMIVSGDFPNGIRFEGENGWLFRDGDADDLARKILQTLERREMLPMIGLSASISRSTTAGPSATRTSTTEMSSMARWMRVSVRAARSAEISPWAALIEFSRRPAS